MKAALLALALGGLAMVSEEEAIGQEKDEPETVTLKRWIPSQKMFIDPKPAKAFRAESKENKEWLIWKPHRGSGSMVSNADPGSEITDKGGTVWVVIKVVSDDWRVCKKKP